jgi:hypothetical protein
MFKLFVVLLSLLSVGSSRVIGSDPKTWSPNGTAIYEAWANFVVVDVVPIDKCDSCKSAVLHISSFIKNHEEEIVDNCPDATCALLAEDAVHAVEKLLENPQTFCENLKVCKTWWSFFP